MHHRARLAAVVAPLLAAILIAALPAGAGARTTHRSFGHWRETFSGSFNYQWNEPNPEPCGVTGGGFVRASFSGRLGRSTINYVRAGAFRAFGLVNNTMRIRGSVTVADNRTVNPPPPDGGTCDPLDKAGCGTRGYDHATFSLESTDSANRPPLHMTMDLGGMPNAFASAGTCYAAGLIDFNYFPGNSPSDSDTHARADNGVLVGPALSISKFARRRRFTAIAQDTHRSTRAPGIHTTRRDVRVTFTPVR